MTTMTMPAREIAQTTMEEQIVRIIAGRSLEQMQADFNARFYIHEVCPVCGAPAPAVTKHLWDRNLTARTCGPACMQMKEIIYHGCCSQARILCDASSVAYHLSLTCPVHGEQRFGTSD